MAAVTAGAPPTMDPGLRLSSLARTTGPAAADRSPVEVRPGRAVRSWPLLVLAVPAAAEVWSGWVGIAQKTGFGLVSPLPGIWPSLHLDTSITLPVGVEAYAAYALRAWLASEHAVSARTRRFAKWSAIFSFALGMAGQVACHLLAQAGAARAPWPITTIVSCLPVLVLGMGTALAHMLRADAASADMKDSRTSGPAGPRSPAWSPDHPPGDQRGPDQGQHHGPDSGSGSPAGTGQSPQRRPGASEQTTAPEHQDARPQMDQARLVARTLAAAGKPVSRRALRAAGAKGSNESLNALARKVNAELADGSTISLSQAAKAGQRLVTAARPHKAVLCLRLDKRKRADSEWGLQWNSRPPATVRELPLFSRKVTEARIIELVVDYRTTTGPTRRLAH